MESRFSYPFIAKPVDDGCSSAVVKISTFAELDHYLKCLFRASAELIKVDREALGLAINEEFPVKNEVLLESLIGSNGAEVFMEVTGGMLSHYEGDEVQMEVFEPSEVLANGAILSLEEKFLAGEGQNITPARFGQKDFDYSQIATEVKSTLRQAAEILGITSYCRIDAFVRIYAGGRVETLIIEVNSLPGMTPATCIFHQCAINNYKPFQFIDKIITFGKERTLKTYSTTI